MSKIIELTQGYSTTVDDEDYERLTEFRWKILKAGNKKYACRTVYKMFTRLMHVSILGEKDGHEIDHKDGDGLNNCKSNLRWCTKGQNQVNVPPRIGGTSEYKGVHWSSRDRRWIAQCGGLYLGSFLNEWDAANQYNVMAEKLYGGVAILNIQKGPNYRPANIAAVLNEQMD